MAFLTWTTPWTSSQSPQHREARVARRPREPDDVIRRRVAIDGLAAHARAHDVGRGALTEVERARQQVRGALLDRAGLGAATHHGAQLLRRAGGGQFLLRFDAHGAQQQVRRSVEYDDERLEEGGEHLYGSRDDLGDAKRRGDTKELRDEFTEDHREGGGENHREDGRGRRGRAAGDADGRQRGAHQRTDAGFDDEAEDQRREGDADLRGRQLRRQPAQRGEDGAGAFVAVVDGALDGVTIQRDERELGGDEQCRSEREDNSEEDQYPLRHDALKLPRAQPFTGLVPPPGPASTGEARAVSRRGGPPHHRPPLAAAARER